MAELERTAQWSVVMADLREREAKQDRLRSKHPLAIPTLLLFRALPDHAGKAFQRHQRLRAGPANAGTLAADFRSSRPAVSKHLRVLREARLVVDTKVGRERVYAVNPVPLQSVAGWLEGYRAFWQASLMRLKRNLEEK